MKKRTITAILMAMAIGLGATAAKAADLHDFRAKVRKYAPDYDGAFTGPKKTLCQCTDGGTWHNAFGWTYHSVANPSADFLVVKGYCVIPRFDGAWASTSPAFCPDFSIVPK